MILPDWQIRKLVHNGDIGITPFTLTHVQPASYDITLDRYFRFYKKVQNSDVVELPIIDVKSPRRMTVQVEANNYFELGPHDFALASSRETFRFPDNIAGRCEGKSSLGRMGLAIHVTAGFFDPGFEGTATLELFNANRYAIRLYPGMKIAQMSFHQMAGQVAAPYGLGTGAKYKGQGIAEPGPRESEYFRNFEDRPFHRSEYEGDWTPPEGPSGDR